MTTVHKGDDGRYRARIGAKARVSIENLTDTTAVLRFEDRNRVLCLSMAREVFPHLVDMIQFAALSPAPPIPEDAPPPHLRGPLIVRKAPGEGDGS